LKERREIPTIIPVDSDIVAWFKAQVEDYQARINAVLRDYVEANPNA